MKLLLTLIGLLTIQSATADFLLVSRNGNLRASPTTESEVLEKIHTGDKLILLDDTKTNGYWHVRATASAQEGWVFQSLVRKIEGDIDGAEPEDDNSVVDIRILDVAAGHSALIKLPGDKYVIYDAGSDARLNGNRTMTQVREYIPAGSTIELMVLSHTDADHINAAWQVLKEYNVRKVLWTGFEASMVGGTTTKAYKRLDSMLHILPGTENVNLHKLDSMISPGNGFSIGSTRFTFLCGFGNPHPGWTDLSSSEKLNAVSIVMKLEFKGNSVLFTGDAVGRHLNDPTDALLATEAFLVSEASDLLASTILIAPHHGARNGSSAEFVRLTQPQFVIFPAGHDHGHPTTRTANLYLQTVAPDHIFRTDRGDDEGDGEWSRGRITGCTDDFNDDTVQIQLRGNGSFRVYYMTENGHCINQ